jgi:hypothetical protein
MDIKKQQRLAAWRQKQQQQQLLQQPPPPPVPPIPQVKVSWNTAVAAASKLRKKKRKLVVDVNATNDVTNLNIKRNPFDDDDDEDEIGEDYNKNNKEQSKDTSVSSSTNTIDALMQPSIVNNEETSRPVQRKRNRWDTNTTDAATETSAANSDSVTKDAAGDNSNKDDTLDQFMAQLHSVAADDAVAKIGNSIVHLSGSVQRTSYIQPIITASRTDLLESAIVESANNTLSASATIRPHPTQEKLTSIYNPNDWLSDVNPNTDNEEEVDTDMEDEQRWELIKALKQEPVPASSILDETSTVNVAATAIEGSSSLVSINDDKLSFREQHQKMVQELAEAAKQVREIQEKSIKDIGREFFIPEEDGIVEEAIREYEAATQQQSDSTFMLLNTVDQTLNKKKELTTHHSESGHEYAPFQKNIYRVAKSVASLTPTEITNRRAKLKIRVRGVQVPAPVLQFHEMGLPESVLQYMTQHHNPPITTPYPIQAQCIPCILAGRDVIGIAKTGSGKTLAYVLPMLRHIIIQPPLQLVGGGGSNMNQSSSSSSVPGHRGETGPIALILVPARELAFQIHNVCKPYAKLLGLK